MSDTITEVKAILTAEDRASAIIRNFRAEADRLAKSLKGLSSINLSGLNRAFSANGLATIGRAVASTEAAASRAIRGRATLEARAARQRVGGEQAADRARRAADAASAAAIRAKFAFVSRMGRQERQEGQRADRERRAAEAANMREFRSRMRFTNSMNRQRVREAREAEQDRQRADATAERDAAQTLRRRIAGDRWRFSLRDRMERRERQEGAQVRRNLGQKGHEALDRGRDAAHDVASGARTITLFSAIGAGIVGSIASAGLKARSAIDTSEANARMFGGMSRDQVQAARDGWLNRAALDNAFRPADALNAWTETLKAGIPQSAAPDVTRSIMGASAGLDLNVAETTRLVGRLSTLTQNPLQFKPEAIDGMLNSIAVVAKTTAADSRELVSSLRRGAGVLGSSKMSVGDLTAFTGAGISAGIQEGKAGTFMDFLVNDLVNAKNQRGQRRVDLEKAFRLLGLGGAQGVSRQAAQDPTKLLMGIFGKMDKMSPDKAGHVASLIGMREWRGEVLQMMKALPSLRQAIDAVRDPKNANHLGQARDEKLGTLAGLRSQLRATGDLALEAIGAGLEDLVRDAGKYLLDLGRGLKLDVIRAHVHTLLDGLVDGLGFRNIRELLERVLGRPGEMDFSRLNNLFEFAQGFGRGLREVIDSVFGIGRLFIGKDASADTMGNFAAKIIGFSAAITMAGPAVGILGAITSGIASLATAAVAGWSALKLAGLAAGASAGATGAAMGAGLRAAVGRLFGGLGLGIVASIGVHRGELATAILTGLRSVWAAVLDGIKVDFAAFSRGGILNGFLRFLDPNFAPDPRTIDQGERGRLRDGIREDRDRGPMGSLWKWLFRSSARGNDVIGGGSSDGRLRGDAGRDRLGARLQPAAFSPVTDIANHTNRMAQAMQTMGLRAQLAAIGAPARDALAAFGGGGSGPAAGSGSAGAFSSRFSTPKGLSVPGWFGKGSGGGASGMPDPGSGAGTGPYKGLLDHIARSEGTANQPGGGYNTSLGYGKFLPGGKEMDLKSMTLDQIDAIQGQMLNHPGNGFNSSALGRYQIVRTTLRSLRQKLGLKGDQLFDANLQDRLGAELVRQRGASPTGLGQEWASLRGAKLGTAVDLARQIPQGASTTPGARPDPAGMAGIAETVAGVGGKAAAAVDVAKTFEGMDEDANHAQLSKFMGREIRGAQNAWCASFVNSSLKAVGLKGTGSAVANSFLGWGQGVEAKDAIKGDVLIEHRGKGLNGQGGHVGLATGRKRLNDRTGELELEMTSGNSSNKVKTEWESASKLAARRSTDPAAQMAAETKAALDATTTKAQRAVEGFTSSGWKPVAPAASGAPSPQAMDAARAFTSTGWKPTPPPAAGNLGTPSAEALAAKAKPPTADELARTMPNRPGLTQGSDFGGRNGAGSLAPLTTVNIHAANMTPAEMGGNLQRHLSEASLYRAHDMEPEIT